MIARIPRSFRHGLVTATLLVVACASVGCSTRSVEGWAQVEPPLEPQAYPVSAPEVRLGATRAAPRTATP